MSQETDVTASEKGTAQGKRSFLRLAGEALWILLAVLLALAADQWRENQANKRLAKRALDGVIEEMEGNRGVLARILPSHQRLLESMPDDVEDWRPPSIEDENNRFDPIFFRDTAWRTALETQALVHLDYQVVRTLTEVYTFQGAYAELNRDLIRSSFSLDAYDPQRLEAQFGMTRYFLFIFVANEQKLLEVYDEALSFFERTN